jgi:uncharacterized protein
MRWGLLLIWSIVVFVLLMLASGEFVGDTHFMSLLKEGKEANHLIEEKSPYLLQHAYNPVDWYPWGAEAFEKAKRESKPIFLSIGYSTCHWCHVMEHESFENPEIAKILNDYFVSIKVDREERPDIDQIYMTATQSMTGSGGWPMSVWLNHDLKPFFCGTYFPPQSAYGRPGFSEILLQIHKVWKSDRSKIDQTAERVAEVLVDMSGSKEAPSDIPPAVIEQAFRHFVQSYDDALGGFGGAPKFPRTVQFPFLFRYYASTGDERALKMALFTLKKMAQGGMYDQLGGGFHRYSVDAEWRVPHFEKMLYDNGQLLSVYTEAWQLTQDPFYKEIAQDIIRYVARDMTDKGGAFYSAEDADSEGEEGTFYVWTDQQVRSVIGDDAAKVIAAHYDFRQGGNFEHGKNVLHGIYSVEETANKTGKKPEEVRKILQEAKQKLFEARSQRPRPHLDDKILTAWNGLMISGLAKAGRAFQDKKYLDQAEKAADFILKNLRDLESGRLLRRYREGEAKGAAFIDDYAFFVDGLIELFQSTQDPRWLREAVRLTDEQIQLLWDKDLGGFFFAGEGDKTLLMRTKSDYEGAEPAGNSVAVLNLLRLAPLANRSQDQSRADLTLKALSGKLKQFAASMPLLVSAYSDSLSKPRQIVIAADLSRSDGQLFWSMVNAKYLPNTILLVASGDTRQTEIAHFMPFFAEMKPQDGKATAYICENFTCKAPITDLTEFKKALDSSIKK